MERYICIIGPDETYKGGMLNVIHQIMDSDIEYDDIKKIHIGTASISKKIKVFISGLVKYIRLCRKKQVVLAHIQLSERGSLYRTIIILHLSRLFKVKTIVHSHGGLFFDHINSMGRMKQRIIRKNLNLSDRVIVLTEGWKNIWSKLVDVSKIRVIPNGTNIPNIDHKEFFADGQYNLLFLGNINPIKGIYELIDSIEIVKSKHIPIKLRVAGGDQIEQCKEYVKNKHLEEEVEVVGWVDGEIKENLFAISDVLVLPSYFESFGLAAIEAMAHRLPVICGDRGYTKEVIINNETGYICKTGNACDIADTIMKLYNFDTIRAFSLRGYKLVKENYELPEVMKNIEAIYNELIYER